ncbi:MAG: DUF6504 family protein [Nostocoides sp.]
MTRQYEEPIEVRTTPIPEAFVWRGRLFVVRTVQDRWQERRSWWHTEEETERASSRERWVWRVEASRGGGTGTGVFDLSLDGDRRWLLLRSHD